MRNICCIAIVLLLAGVEGKAQNEHRLELTPVIKHSTDLYLGFHLQGKFNTGGETRKFAEVGLARTKIVDLTHHPASTFTYYVSSEILLADRPFYGFKAGAWFQGWLMSLGASAIYYTDFKEGNFKLRPELGVGANRFRLGFGYNIPTIRNRDFEKMTHYDMQIFLNYLLPLKTTIGNRQKPQSP